MQRVSFPFPVDPTGKITFKSFSDPQDGSRWIADAEEMVKAAPGEGFSCVLGEGAGTSETGALLEMDGQNVGWIVLFLCDGGSVILFKILIVAARRGQGIGTHVSDLLIAAAKQHGYTDFSVRVHENLVRAQLYWRRFAMERGMVEMGALYSLAFFDAT